ncbi:hypothetical protein ACFL41_02480 [Gemmatimonadota bacterium]
MFIFFLSACGGDKELGLSLEEEFLEEGVPFDKLGSGKIVFDREGHVYVIDVAKRRSWWIDNLRNELTKAPMVSPDGSKIAFSLWTDSNNWDIHVMNIDGSDIQNISNHEGTDRQPSWTPDSNEVLFYYYVDRTLYRQSLVSNPPDRQAIRDFSAEGSMYSPVSVSKNFKLVFCLSNRIHTMNLDGTSLNPIETEIPGGILVGRSPCWSPDGQSIACVLPGDWIDDQWTSLGVMVMDADGKNARSLGNFEMNSYGGWYGSLPGTNDFSICWSPDGSKLLFSKIDGYLTSHIYLINADGTGLSQVTFADGKWDRSLSWSY